MRALSIRQPYAEMILRGEKTIEYRSRPTKIIGERFYIYASKNRGQVSGIRGQGHAADSCLLPPDSLLRGVIVGTAVISHVTNGGPPGSSAYEWHLTDVQRIKHPRKPQRMPQPVWFKPF